MPGIPKLIIIAGSYQHTLYGLTLEEFEKNDQKTYKLVPMFVKPNSHLGCVKTCAITSNGNWLVTGSSDEIINIYNLKKRVEDGSIGGVHDGSITHLEFHENSHLISSSEDGKICIWRRKDWESLKVLNAHKGAVINFSIHPTGKVAISIGKDKFLKLWNLIDATCAYETRLQNEPIMVMWFPCGTKYLIMYQRQIECFKKTGKIIFSVQSDTKLHWVTHVKEGLIATGGEDHRIQFWNSLSGEKLSSLLGHTNRFDSIYL
eukprot:TRINITY_DN2167_c1_g2_i1.p1 TRINITY_DN2167_c1_g2~~TRINITY_DN2167_c1_g2_i1.p1  ORF type:complete len:261 (-),score=70.47 TRINITY_DN2167_c1_g2_i1:24-806(-)